MLLACYAALLMFFCHDADYYAAMQRLFIVTMMMPPRHANIRDVC